jgi:hypothetical protein
MLSRRYVSVSYSLEEAKACLPFESPRDQPGAAVQKGFEAAFDTGVPDTRAISGWDKVAAH